THLACSFLQISVMTSASNPTMSPWAFLYSKGAYPGSMPILSSCQSLADAVAPNPADTLSITASSQFFIFMILLLPEILSNIGNVPALAAWLWQNSMPAFPYSVIVLICIESDH